MIGLWLHLFFPETVTPDRRGQLGGVPNFNPPRPDPAARVKHGLPPYELPSQEPR